MTPRPRSQSPTPRTALVTGASSGLGSEFARRLAARGHDLVITGRRLDRLEALRTDLLAADPHRSVTACAADLADPAGPAGLCEELERAGRPIDLLVNNAGFGTLTDLVDTDPEGLRGEIAVNCTALTLLTRALVPGMVERGHGGVINVASTAAFQPVPGMAVYAATKAFVRSFTFALGEELRGTGVRVLCVNPGPTETEFFATGGGADLMQRGRRTPAQVVETALAAWDAGRGEATDGRSNRAVAQLGGRLPPALSAHLVRQRMR